MRKGVIIVIGIVPITVYAEEGIQSGIGVKLGYFIPGDDDVNEIYGSGLTFGADYLYLFLGKSFGANFGIEYFSKGRTSYIDGTPVDQSWAVASISGGFVYFPTSEKSFFIGLGMGNYSAKETIKVGGISISVSESALGFHLMGGYNFDSFFGEVKISSVDVDGVNAGGMSILAGYRF